MALLKIYLTKLKYGITENLFDKIKIWQRLEVLLERSGSVREGKKHDTLC
jgi:hypothetical protein